MALNSAPGRDHIPAEPGPAESLLLRPVWIVGVLGHRTLAQPAAVEAVFERELRGILAAAARHSGELHVQTSAAAGTDLLAIRVARRLGLPVHVLLPLKEEEFFQDFAGHAAELAEAQAALAEARANRHRDSVRVALTTVSRPACYFDTDIRIVETSDLLTVWNGAGTDQLGGTGQIASLARALGKPSVFIHPDTLTVTTESYDPTAWPPTDEQSDRIADGLVSTSDHQRRSNRFRNTIAALTLFARELPHLQTEDSIRNLVRRTEELLLAEQIEWRLATRKLKV
jgi:hypothetical protein